MEAMDVMEIVCDKVIYFSAKVVKFFGKNDTYLTTKTTKKAQGSQIFYLKYCKNGA